MNWIEPRFIITLLLIGLFGFAYINDPSDEAMKGALIGAFSAAYGFWIGSKSNEKATENTGKAFDAIKAAAHAGAPGDGQVAQAAQEVADEAQGAANDIKAGKPPASDDAGLPEALR